MLEDQLKPLMKYIGRKGATEILVNRFKEVWVECAGEDPRAFTDAALDQGYFERLARLMSNELDITNFDKKPILKASLPGKHRMTLAIGRFVKSGIALSVRVARNVRFELSSYGATPEQIDIITDAIARKANIVISGGTYSGKTQFMNALLRKLDPRDRILSAEDVDELELDHSENRVEFLINQLQADLQVGYNDVIDAMTRMRPDRIIVGELSIANTWTLLRLLNTGHGGLITTVHADSPDLAFRAIERNVQLAGQSTSGVTEYFRETIDVVIQLRRRPNSHIREVAALYLKPSLESRSAALAGAA